MLALGIGLADCPVRPLSVMLDPARDYADAVGRAERRQAMDDSVVATGGRSILLVHGRRTPRVFVLLHGFTDSPRQFEALGQTFFASGANVYIPRLPHHAERKGKVAALGRVKAGELAAFGDSVVNVARGLGDTVIVVGLSAGATVGAAIVQHRPDVTRVVLVAPAIAAGRVSDRDNETLVDLASRLPNVTRTDPPDTAHPDFEHGISTRGLAQVLRLGELVRQEADSKAPGVKQPIFLLNANDRTVSEGAAIDLACRWSEHGALMLVYRFPRALRLPHNVMETTERGGNVALAYPTIVALALGQPTTPSAPYQIVHCGRGEDPLLAP
jgi:carboxylesterase